jgi:hypothetical protein
LITEQCCERPNDGTRKETAYQDAVKFINRITIAMPPVKTNEMQAEQPRYDMKRDEASMDAYRWYAEVRWKPFRHCPEETHMVSEHESDESHQRILHEQDEWHKRIEP